MSNGNTNTQFFKYAAELVDSSPETVRKYYQACVDTLIHMLHFDGRCHLPYVGVFTLEEMPERTVIAKDADGELVERTNPAWFKILYKTNEDFLNNVNGRGVTKKYRKRVRERKLTKNDLKLITQAEMERTAKKTLKQQQDDRIAEAKKNSYDDFINVINQKKEDYERKKKEKELNEQANEDTTGE